MMYTLLFTMAVIVLVSLGSATSSSDDKAIDLDPNMFKTDKMFNLGAYAILIILAVLYSVFW